MTEKLYSCLNRIGYALQSFVQGGRNLLTWAPIIWRDRQYDYSFLLKMNHKKLELMEDYFKHSTIRCGRTALAREIGIARVLAGRLVKNEYSQRYDDMTRNLLALEGWSEEEIEGAERYLIADFFKDEGEEIAASSREVKLAEIIRRSWLEEAAYGQDRQLSDSRYLGQFMAKRMFGWWD